MKKNNTLPMPTGPDIFAATTALLYVNKLDVLIENFRKFGKDTTVSVSEDKRQVSFTSKTGSVTIRLPSDQKGVSHNKNNMDKLYTFILCKIAEDAIYKQNEYTMTVSFPLQELVDCGIFKSVRSARQGYLDIIDYLSNVGILSTRNISRGIRKRTDEITKLVFKGRIENGICQVYLDADLNWNVMAKPFINMPKETFALSSQSFKMVKALYRYIRINCITEKFTLSMGYLIEKTGIVVDPRVPKRVIETITGCIDEINDNPKLNLYLIPCFKKENALEETLANSSVIVITRKKIIKDMEQIKSLQTEKNTEEKE